MVSFGEFFLGVSYLTALGAGADDQRQEWGRWSITDANRLQFAQVEVGQI